jgi:hypothetical protein
MSFQMFEADWEQIKSRPKADQRQAKTDQKQVKNKSKTLANHLGGMYRSNEYFIGKGLLHI